MVLFVQPATTAVPVAWGRRVRLLLHGSARHLVGRSPHQLEYDVTGSTEVEGSRPSGSDSESFSFLVSNADMLSSALGRRHVDPCGDRESVISDDYLSAALGNLMSAVDRHLDPGSAAWMAGYARVTRFVKHYPTRLNYLVATPLYVMYSTPAPTLASLPDRHRRPALEDVGPIEWPEE
jgi:hypothetical protein